jgi:hypothetical protein
MGDFKPPSKSKNPNNYQTFYKFMLAYEKKSHGHEFSHLPKDFYDAIVNYFESLPNKQRPLARMETAWRQSGQGNFIPPNLKENPGDHSAFWRLKKAIENNGLENELSNLPEDFADALRKYFETPPEKTGPWARMEAAWRNSGQGTFSPPDRTENKSDYSAFTRLKVAFSKNAKSGEFSSLPKDFFKAIVNYLENLTEKVGPWVRMETEWRNSGQGAFVPPLQRKNASEYVTFRKLRDAYRKDPTSELFSHLPEDFAIAIKDYLDRNP